MASDYDPEQPFPPPPRLPRELFEAAPAHPEFAVAAARYHAVLAAAAAGMSSATPSRTTSDVPTVAPPRSKEHAA